MATIRLILFRLGHLGFLIASCGFSFVYFFNVLTGHPRAFLGPILAFLTVFVVYNFDHLRDSHGFDRASTPERARYMIRYEKVFRGLIAASGAGYLALAAAFRPWALAIGAFYALSGGLYVLPFLPGPRIRRLKDIPFFKNVYVPACWLILILYSKADWHSFGAAERLGMGFLFPRLIVSVATGDIRDQHGDSAANLRTIATALGGRGAMYLLQSLNVLSVAWIAFACLRGYWPMAALTMIGPVLYIVGLLAVMGRYPSQGEFVSEIFDFELISYGPLMLLATLAAR
ncbi:MAG: UbiA family prenyltransferase [Fibrobacteria bacterium]